MAHGWYNVRRYIVKLWGLHYSQSSVARKDGMSE